jgi:hypothetical protein
MSLQPLLAWTGAVTFRAVHLRSPPKADAIIISGASERTEGGYLIDQTSYFLATVWDQTEENRSYGMRPL